MAGHSKWANIKHRKAAADAKRGKIFTQLIKEISVAARIGGGDLDANPRLRSAVSAAKGANMPQDNIKRAILKGTGELPGQSFEEASYEGYGPGGVAVFVESLTDNRNRTVAEIRHMFSRHGGNLGENGSVSWIFEKKGLILVPEAASDEEQLLEVILDAGGEDLELEGDLFVVYTSFEQFEEVRKAFESAGIEIESAQLTMIPQNSIRLDGKQARQMLALMGALEDHDDVQNAYANFDIDDAELESMAF